MADDIINNYNNNQYLGNGEVDSDGHLLPARFDAQPANVTYTWTGPGNLFPGTKVETKTLPGVGIYVRTTTYTNNGSRPTGRSTSAWVKQP